VVEEHAFSSITSQCFTVQAHASAHSVYVVDRLIAGSKQDIEGITGIPGGCVQHEKAGSHGTLSRQGNNLKQASTDESDDFEEVHTSHSPEDGDDEEQFQEHSIRVQREARQGRR
jgi:hypothetical protein